MKVKYDPHKGCPMCGGFNLDSYMRVIDEETIYCDMKCNDCGFEWIDVLSWTHSITADGNEEELVVQSDEDYDRRRKDE